MLVVLICAGLKRGKVLFVVLFSWRDFWIEKSGVRQKCARLVDGSDRFVKDREGARVPNLGRSNRIQTRI